MNKSSVLNYETHVYQARKKGCSTVQIDVVGKDSASKEQALAILRLNGDRTVYLHAFYPNGVGYLGISDQHSSALMEHVNNAVLDQKRNRPTLCQMVAFAPSSAEQEMLCHYGFVPVHNHPNHYSKKL